MPVTVSSHAGDSLRGLVTLSKKLAAARDPPLVVRVKGAKHDSEVPGEEAGNLADVFRHADGASSPPDIIATGRSMSAGTQWHARKAQHVHLEKEWREWQGRAGRALLLLEGEGGETLHELSD